MNRPRVELAFDERFAVLRVVVTGAALIGNVLLVESVSGWREWWPAAVGLLLSLIGVRWALAALVAQSCLLMAAHALGSEVVPALKVLAAITLFELALRHRGARLVVGTMTLAAAVAANRWADLPQELPTVLYKMGIVAGVPLLVGSYVRVARDAAEQARARTRQEEQRQEERLLAVRTAERTAIARELHDLVAHHVSSMVLRVGVARHVILDARTPHTTECVPVPSGVNSTARTSETRAGTGTEPATATGSGTGTGTAMGNSPVDPRIVEVFDDLHTSGSAALADLRRLVAVLRDPDGVERGDATVVTPGSLTAALEAVVARSGPTGLAVHATLDPAVARLDVVRGLAVLRLVQEGLANAARHAGPGARAELTVRMADDGAALITVQDDGPTDGGPPAAHTDGHGLIGMRERVELLGGRLDAGPSGAGWRLAAELPPPAPEREPRR
ncbi:sensor histidine kinase [Streptomyces sp. NPDC056500]|uniref:sensor histidine kinase n=1 Tax=Streptomyces sp. NPDC056500 TaxID=3345840 RepID=UPI00368FA546